MQKDIVVLVKTDFLKHENEFNLMRAFVSDLKPEDVKLFDEFNYDCEEDKIVHIHQSFYEYSSTLTLICEKLENGYMAISLYMLKQLLSL